MIFKSSLPDAVISEISVGTRILDKISTFGDRVALVNGDTGKEITFSKLKNDVIEYSAILWSLGVRKGHVVMLVIPFDPDYVPLLVAIVTCGAIINFAYTYENHEAMTSHINDVNPFLIVTKNSDLTEFKVPRHVLTLTDIRDLALTLDPTTRVFPDDVLIDVHKDPFAIFNSSGTTGKSKRIVVTHYAINAVFDRNRRFRIDQSDCILLSLPIFSYGSITRILRPILEGIKVVLSEHMTLSNLYKTVSKYKCTMLICANAPVLMEVLNTGKVSELKSLKCISFGGMPFPVHMREKAKQKLGIPIICSYGTTEIGNITIGPVDTCPANSVGKLLSNTDARVIDYVTGKNLDVGKPGEILAKGPSVMKGYYCAEGADIHAIDSDGWFHTGDVGYFDSSGFLYILDRIKNVIKGPRGKTIYPTEIQNILLKHPSVKDAAVVGVYNLEHFETPKAFVVSKNEFADADEILKFYNEQVPDFKQIRGGLEFIEVMPRVGIGKIDRNKLKKLHEKSNPVDK